jgi:hypothetical protein
MTAPPEVDPFKGTPYENSSSGWWTEYGGALDVISGVIYVPSGSRKLPCSVPGCKRCQRKNQES